MGKVGPSRHGECKGSPIRVALVTQGYFSAGGVQTVARWLKANMENAGFSVSVYEIEASRSSEHSRSILKPAAWRTKPSIAPSVSENGVFHVGAVLSEIEIARYRPRSELTELLNQYDFVQVVCGGPALAYVTRDLVVPVLIQMATLMAWERSAVIASSRGFARFRLKAMTHIVSRVERHALKCAHTVLVENSEIYQVLSDFKLPNLVLAPPGLDTDLFKPTSVLPRSSSGPLVFLGRLAEPRKGITRLLNSYIDCVSIDKSLPNLVLAGRGSLSLSDQELIEQSGVAERITVRNDLSEEEKLELLRSASIFVQASFEEGLGVSVLEAMACGLPVIATWTAGTAETVVSGETGFLIPQDEFDAEAMLSALRAIRDDYGSFSQRGREIAVERHSERVTFERYLAAYCSVMDAS